MIQRMNETPDSCGVTPLALWPGRRWWLLLLLILLPGAGLRYTGYNFSLPYIDHPDEPNHNLAARMIVDLGTARSLDHDSYAPGIVAVNYFFARYFHDPVTPPSTVLWMVRLVSVTTSVGLLVVLALFGYHLAGPPAGLLATALWAITPIYVSVSRFGIPDIYVTFFSILSLWLTLAGIRYLRPRWTTYAVYALMLAILFKYQAIFLTPVILLAPLVLRDAMRRVVAGNILRFVLFLAWLLLFTPILAPPDPGAPPNWRQHTTSVGIPSPEVLLYNLEQLLRPLDLRLLLPGWAGLALLALRRNREILYCLALPVIAVGVDVRVESVWKDRCSSDAGPGNPADATGRNWLGIVAAGFARLVRAVYAAVEPVCAWRTVACLAGTGAALVAGINRQCPEHTLPDRRNELATWADTTLAPGKFFASSANHKTLNRDWGGYAGETSFTYVGEHNLVERSLEEWRAGGVSFAILPWYEYEALLKDDPQRYLAGTTLLKAWPPSEAHRGPSMVVLALQAMQHSLPAAAGQLGSIRLLGHDLNVTDALAGAELPLQLYWQADAPADGEYIAHLLDAAGNLVAQAACRPDGAARATGMTRRKEVVFRVAVRALPAINGWYREIRVSACTRRDHIADV